MTDDTLLESATRSAADADVTKVKLLVKPTGVRYSEEKSKQGTSLSGLPVRLCTHVGKPHCYTTAAGSAAMLLQDFSRQVERYLVSGRSCGISQNTMQCLSYWNCGPFGLSSQRASNPNLSISWSSDCRLYILSCFSSAI